MKIKLGDIEKTGLFTVGMGLIAFGADTLKNADVVVGTIAVGMGFICILGGILWIEKQIVETVKKLGKKPK